MMSNLVPVDNDVTHIPCPQCGGEGRVEYERPVVDYERGGYLEGYYDECDECGGFGEVEFVPERVCVVDEYGNLYWKDEPRF